MIFQEIYEAVKVSTWSAARIFKAIGPDSRRMLLISRRALPLATFSGLDGRAGHPTGESQAGDLQEVGGV
jgi:hypothetical protein